MNHFLISLILSLILAGFAYLKKALTKPALLLAFILCLIITYSGGLTSFIILTVVFLGSQISKIISPAKAKPETQKNIFQILANVLLGAISLLIYYFTKNSFFPVVYASLMAEALSDTMASDIGILSKKEPINILTLKRSKPGLSGNISTLGLAASLASSLTIALIFSFSNFDLTSLLIITFSGFLGALLDSLFGALIQVKYQCPVCHKITEEKNHCDTPTTHYQGLKYIDNNAINFLSNLISGIISFVLYIFI